MFADRRLRFAVPDDLALLHALIERAYRGDTARVGWTHEADLLDDQRTDLTELAAIIGNANDRIILAEEGELIGCVYISDKRNGTCYLGLLCVDPPRQTAGLGKHLITAAETQAVALFGATCMEMTVIEHRSELIRYYERRGYRQTGERRPFPVPRIPALAFVVLTKPLLSVEA